MKDSIFRKYDIRGIVGSELFIEEVYALARAMAFYLQDQQPNLKTVAVAMDGRLHSPAIKDELIQAFLDSGINVTFIGLCPTPLLYFATHKLPVEAGIIITASHNPKEYNGFKIVLNKEALSSEQIEEVKRAYRLGKNIASIRKGRYKEQSIFDQYLKSLVGQFDHLKDLDVAAAIDCGNGTAGTVIPDLIEAMNWKGCATLFENIDGSYPNHEADPTKKENLKQLKQHLEDSQCKIGIGFDGDVDRIGVMTKSGTLIPNDQLIGLFSKLILQNHPGSAIVYDVRCSGGLAELLERWQGKPKPSPCGSSSIKAAMKKNSAKFGGELSGHFCFADKHDGYDDAIYAMMRLFETCKVFDQDLETLLKEFPVRASTPEIRLSCKEEDKLKIIDKVKNQIKKKKEFKTNFVDGVQFISPCYWAIIRPSNTQAEISLRMEAKTEKELAELKKLTIEMINEFFSADYLNKMFDLK